MTPKVPALILLSLLLPCLVAPAHTEEEQKGYSVRKKADAPADTTAAAAGDSTAVMDAAPQNPNDTFGTVSKADPHDIRFLGKDDGWEIFFHCDPANEGNWLESEPDSGPFDVYVGGLKPGCFKGKGPNAKLEPVGTDGLVWRLQFKDHGKIRMHLIFRSKATGVVGAGNIVWSSNAMVWGQKCGYQWDFHKDGTVIPKPEGFDE